jgi:hypothetical protein
MKGLFLWIRRRTDFENRFFWKSLGIAFKAKLYKSLGWLLNVEMWIDSLYQLGQELQNELQCKKN